MFEELNEMELLEVEGGASDVTIGHDPTKPGGGGGGGSLWYPRKYYCLN